MQKHEFANSPIGPIYVGSETWREADHGAGDVRTLFLVDHLEKLFAHAERVATIEPRDDEGSNVIAVHKLATKVRVGRDRPSFFVAWVKEDNNGRMYYTHFVVDQLRREFLLKAVSAEPWVTSYGPDREAVQNPPMHGAALRLRVSPPGCLFKSRRFHGRR